MQIVGSPDITNLDVDVTWNISGTSPYITLNNLSIGSGLANVKWWIEAFSPSNTPIHQGTASAVDITGVWTTKNITESWPRPEYAIEWSGAPYVVTLHAQDSNGQVYSITKTRMISRPTGVISGSKTYFGKGDIHLQVKCEQARVYFEDRTNATYGGIIGTRIDSVLTMSYPVDDNGADMKAFKATNFTNALVPISFSSSGYSFVSYSVYEYNYGDGTRVRVKYMTRDTFPVLCNIELGQLFCDIERLSEEVQNGRCENLEESSRKLSLINSKFSLAVLGKIEPLSGINVPQLIDEIKQIGGFTCTCISPDAGIIPQTASIIDGYSFDVERVGGDVDGEVVRNGPNITIRIWDKTYVIAMWPGSPFDTTAFSFIPQTSPDGYIKYNYLKVDTQQLATDLATKIKNNAYLLNLWEEIGGAGAERKFIVDGRCVFQSTSTSNYDFVLKNIPTASTFAILTGVKVNGVGKNLNFNFNLTNTVALQAYLNSLAIGAFVVTKPTPNPGNLINIATDANPNVLDGLQFSISSTTYTADQTKETTGYVPIDDNVVIDSIIKYICGLSDLQVVTSEDYIIKYVDAGGVEKTYTVVKGSTMNELIEQIIKFNNSNLGVLAGQGGADCESLRALFKPNTSPVTAGDLLFGTKGDGQCSGISYLDAFNNMLTLARTNATTMNLVCGLIQQCGAGQQALPFNYLEVIVTSYNTSCTQIAGIEYTLN